MVTNEQLYLAIGIPLLFNAFLFTLMNSALNSKLDAFRSEMNSKFAAIDRRFDDMRDLWRAELHRVEEVLDARLKHLESH
jgi:hypothetical protein